MRLGCSPHRSVRSVVHLTSLLRTAWLRSSLRKMASTFCCAVRSSRSSICAFLVRGVEPVFLRGQGCVFGIQLLEVRQRPEPVGLEIGASGLVHSKLCTVLLPKRCGVPQRGSASVQEACTADKPQDARAVPEGVHAGIHVFDHRQCISPCWVCSSAMRWCRHLRW